VELFALLEPFIRASQKSEKLLYFLLKHQKSPSIKLMLDKIALKALISLKWTLFINYQKRGFIPQNG
jgi:hypothetical protein